MAGGGGAERGRASICAQRRLQRQQILAEQGALTEEKEMGERPNAQFRIKKKKKKNRRRVRHMERGNKAELAQPANN